MATTVLPKTMDITVAGTDQTEMLGAVMGLYLGMTAFCAIAAFKPEWRHVATIWAVFFMYSIAFGRILSLIDGVPIASSCSTWRSSWLPARPASTCFPARGGSLRLELRSSVL